MHSIRGISFNHMHMRTAPHQISPRAHLLLDLRLRQRIRQIIHILVVLLRDLGLLSLLVRDDIPRSLLLRLDALILLVATRLGLLILILFFVLVLRLQLVEIAHAPVLVVLVLDARGFPALAELLAQLLDGRVLGVELVALELDATQRGEVVQRLGEPRDALCVDFVELEAEDLELRVVPLCQGVGEGDAAASAEETVADAEVADVRPVCDDVCEGARAGRGEGVVLQIEDLDLARVGEAVGQDVRDALCADAVLHHLDLLDARVGGERLGPRRHAAVLEAVAAADDGFEVGHGGGAGGAGGGFLGGEGGEGVGDEDARGGAEPVVVQDEVAEGDMLGEEVDERGLRVEAEGVVGEVDGVEVREGEEGGEEGGEGLWDLREEAAREDVGEVGDLEGGGN